MSVNIKQLDGSLQKIAGNTILLDATCAEVRSGSFSTELISADGYATVNVVFSTPMPDANYVAILNPRTGAWIKANYMVSDKTTTGFTALCSNTYAAGGMPTQIVDYYAFRLVELTGYTALQNKVSDPDSTPTDNSTNLVTSGGVYDAIKNASSVFIGTSSEWESETSKTDYQIAILTDKPNVNAVDSTDGTTTVVGEPNKRWVGTQAEWGNLTTAEKAKYEIVCFNDDNGESGKDIYSTIETKTNKVWIDGKPIYRKVFTDVPFPEEVDIVQADTAAVIRNTDAFPANYISNIVSASFVAINRTGGNQCNLPRRWGTTDPKTGESMIAVIDASINSQGENRVYELEVRSNRTTWNNTTYKVRAIIEYTKVGD